MTLRTLIVSAALLGSATSQAGGYMSADAGVLGAARAGAFVAGAEGQFAQYYNPAGLIRTATPTINFGMTGVSKWTSFTNVCPTTSTTTSTSGASEDECQVGTVSNTAPAFPVPQGGFVTPVGDDLTVAFGLYTPFAPVLSYDRDGPQRYSLVGISILNGSVGPSIAWQAAEKLTLGLGLQAQFLMIEEEIVVSTLGTTETIGDVFVSAAVEDRFSPSYNLGLLLEATDWVTFGFSYQPSVEFSGEGTLELDLTDNILAAFYETNHTDDAVGVGITMPGVIRAGMMLVPSDRAELEFAVVYERWRSLSEITVTDIDLLIESDTSGFPPQEVPNEMALPANFNNTWSFRLGGDFDLSERFTLRGGALYETAAVESTDLSAAMFDMPKVMIASGSSLHMLKGRLSIDTAITYTKFIDTTVDDSIVEVVVINDLIEDDPSIVGNGDYSASGLTVGAQVRYAFGSP